jgi:hypothetical protein
MPLAGSNHLPDLLLVFQVGRTDLQGLRLERKPLLLQVLTPRFLDLVESAWQVSLREESRLAHSFGFDQDVEAAVRVLSQEGCLIRNVVFADLLCLFGQKLEALSVAVARVKQQQTVEIVTFLVA